jgi:hypothetical protein
LLGVEGMAVEDLPLQVEALLPVKVLVLLL